MAAEQCFLRALRHHFEFLEYNILISKVNKKRKRVIAAVVIAMTSALTEYFSLTCNSPSYPFFSVVQSRLYVAVKSTYCNMLVTASKLS